MQLYEQFMGLPNLTKLLLCITILLIVVSLFGNIKLPGQTEGFQQDNKFLFKQGPEAYDDFYVDIYDYLVFSDMKNDYEVGEIINKTNATSKSVILDIGSGTGHHVAALSSQNLDVIGIDISPSMVKKAKENYPDYKFKVANALNGGTFPNSTFTHILCMYFTIYYMQDKPLFFRNCFDWLMPGGHLIVHLVDRNNFDPMLPPANPLYVVSPQKYAKERLTKSKVVFNNFEYTANFDLPPGQSKAIFAEKFKFSDGKARKQEQTLYMESIDDIVNFAKQAGFILNSKIDLVKVAYEYQYLFVFEKPASF
jgi:SAM-dependent methyltransferase